MLRIHIKTYTKYLQLAIVLQQKYSFYVSLLTIGVRSLGHLILDKYRGYVFTLLGVQIYLIVVQRLSFGKWRLHFCFENGAPRFFKKAAVM